MKASVFVLILPVLLAAFALGAASSAAPRAEPQLAHMVFFTLKDRTKEGREAFLASCQKYLAGHDGVAYCSFGTIAEDVVEPVSVRDFDVSLHLVFETKDAEAKYLNSPRHDEFVKTCKSLWSQVRVFDTYVAAK